MDDTAGGPERPGRLKQTVLAVAALLVAAALVAFAIVRPSLTSGPAEQTAVPAEQTAQPATEPMDDADLPPRTIVRIDAGADAPSVDADGYGWQPDGAFVGDPSSRAGTDEAVSGAQMGAMYATARVDPIAYAFPVPNGCYRVITHHAELDPDVDVGDRRTAVWVEGDVEIVDAVADVGPLTALSQQFPQVDVSDGSVDVRFAGLGPEAPTVAGIEVREDTGCVGSRSSQPDVDVKGLVEDAVAAGEEYVRIPPGEHRVSDTIIVDDGGGIVIDATDATLVFTCTRDSPEGCSAFRVTGQGATLRGATIDFDPLPFTQGVITEKSGTTVTVALDPGYPDVDWFVRTSPQHQLHFGADGQWKQPVMPFASVARGSDSRTAVLSVQPIQAPDLAVGDRIALTARGGANAIEALFGDGEFRLEQVTILSATGLAVYGQHWAGSATFAFPTVQRGPRPDGAATDRLISTNQDALRWVVGRSGPTVYGADIGWQGDDGINFQGYPFTVESVESATSVVLRPVVKWVSPDEVFAPGDRLRIMDLPGAAIRSEQAIESIDEFTAPDGGTVFRLTLAGPVEASVGQIADVPEHNSPDAVVRSSWFHDHVAQGIRVKGSDWLVAGNAFDRLVGGHGVLVSPDYRAPGWSESGWVDGLIVTRNVFRDIGSRDDHDAVTVAEFDSSFDGHRDISITDNTVDGVGGHGISLRNVQDAVVAGNRIAGSGLAPIDVDADNSSVTVAP